MMLLADRFQTDTNSHKFAHDTTAQPRQKNNAYSQHTPVDISPHIFTRHTMANGVCIGKSTTQTCLNIIPQKIYHTTQRTHDNNQHA